MADPTGAEFLDRDRLVYHRGRVVYALDSTSRIYRHALDVPNGARCGCVCDECESKLVAKANLPDEVYLREAHFAHEAGAHCQPTGERGLLEAFKLALIAKASFTLPAVEFAPEPGDATTVRFSPAGPVEVREVRQLDGWTARHPDLFLVTSTLDVRVTISVRGTPNEGHRLAAEKNGTNLLWIRVQPDDEGKIYLGDVVDELEKPAMSQWVHHVAAAAQERAAQAEALARRQETARRERELIETYRRGITPPGAIVGQAQRTTGTFWCAACNWKNSRFIPDSPGSKFGRCAHCGAPASPTQLSE